MMNMPMSTKMVNLEKRNAGILLIVKREAELIYGHTAKTKEDFARMIEKDEWDQLLRPREN